MFNLIRRDAILEKWELLLFIPFILVFIIAGLPPAFIFVVASIFIPFNTFSYDAKAETNILLNSLPYTRMEIIAARYLGAIVYMILSIALTSLLLFIFNIPFTITDIAFGSYLFLLFTAFTFPLFYIFKPAYMMWVVIVSFILLTWSIPPIVWFVTEYFTGITDFIANLSTSALYTGAAIAVLAFYAISWLITTFIYKRKVF